MQKEKGSGRREDALEPSKDQLPSRITSNNTAKASPAQRQTMPELALYDGKNFLGMLVQQDRHGWKAVTGNGEEIGHFNHRDYAARALLARHRGGASATIEGVDGET